MYLKALFVQQKNVCFIHEIDRCCNYHGYTLYSQSKNI